VRGRFVAVLAAAASVAAPVAAGTTPPQPGPWRQVGVRAQSGTAPRISRRWSIRDPQALAFVVDAPAGKRVHVRWASYCESGNDDLSENRQGVLDGVSPLVSYPTVYPAATLCYIWLTVTSKTATHLSAAVFSY
jgi:hypothetical protein